MNHFLFRLSLTYCTLILGFISNAQTINSKEYKSQFLTHLYTENLKGNSRQIWDMDTDENGVLYFATSYGISINCFGFWDTFVPDNQKKYFYRSICVVNDSIWVGGTNHLALLLRDEFGALYEMEYPDYTAPGNLWNIEKTSSTIYFQTEHHIVQYDRHSKTMLTHSSPSRIYKIFIFNNKAWMIDRSGTISKISRNGFQHVNTIKELKDREVREVLCHNKSITFVTITGKLINYNPTTSDHNTISVTPTVPDVFSAANLTQNQWVFGTISEGAKVTDNLGKDHSKISIKNTIDQESGLNDNTILSTLVDKKQQLWLGLDYGIAYAEVNSAFRKLFTGASVSTTIEHNETLHIGTNKGLYTYNDETEEFILKKGSGGQVWQLNSYDGELYVCHNNGVMKLDTLGKLKSVVKLDGALAMEQVNRDYFLVSTYSETSLYKKIGENFQRIEQISNIPMTRMSHNIQERNSEYYLISDNGNAIYLSFEEHNVSKKIEFEIDNIFVVNEEVLLYKDGKFYTPSIAANAVNTVPSTTEPFSNINRLDITSVQVSENNEYILLRTHEGLIMYSQQINGGYIEHKNLFGKLNETLNNYGDGFALNENKILIYSGQSLFSYDLKYRKKQKKQKPILYSIKSEEGKEHIHMSFPATVEYKNKFDFYSSVQFRFAVDHLLNDQVEYAYRLLPDHIEFSSWTSDQVTRYNNLSDGNYSFEVKSKINGVETETTKFNLYVNGKWYEKPIGEIAVFAFFLILILAIIFIRTKLLSEKRAQFLKEKHQSEIVELKSEQATRFLTIIEQKNAFLDKVSDSLKRMNNERARSLINLISEEGKKESNDYLYYSFLANNHQVFIDALHQNYPSLTQNDLRLSMFIKMNLTSKDIASIMHISLSGVEKARYRLRKKMNLKPEQDLVSVFQDM